MKFLVPFHLLFVAGAWYGFPVKFSSDSPPAEIVAAVAAATPYFRPASAFGLGTAWTWLLFVLTLAISAALIRGMTRRAHRDEVQVYIERERLDRDPDDRPPGLGFLKAALFTALAIATVVVPLTGGAIDGSLHRREILIANAVALRAAPLRIRPAAPGMGTRHRITADQRGVLIRNATIRDLAALAYGVHPYFVRGNHFVASGEEDWLTGSRHDVYVTAPLREPERFDTYALRQPLTKLLAEQFGLEIYVNGDCQPPCGTWGVAFEPGPL